MHIRFPSIALSISIFVCGSAVAVGAQSTNFGKPLSEEGRILQALLDELRLLRRDTRRTAVLQATLAQMQSAQANVESITRVLQTATSRVTQVREEITRTQNDVKEEEEALSREDDAEQRRTHERNIEFQKKRLSALPDEAQKMETRERDLTDELLVAQRRFEAVNKKLDELLRQLDVP